LDDDDDDDDDDDEELSEELVDFSFLFLDLVSPARPPEPRP
jgi:hypothetical protein